MVLDKEFDLIVIGSNLGAYISAALSAKRGLSVLLVDNLEVRNSYSFNGFKFDYVPQYSQWFYPERLFDKIFQELSLSINEQSEIRKISSTYQVIMPNVRINISDNLPYLKNEIKREFPHLAEKIMLFYKYINHYYDITSSLLEKDFLFPPSTFHEKSAYQKILYSHSYSGLKKFKTLQEFLTSLGLQNTEFEIFIKAQINLFSFTYSENPTFVQAVRILGNIMRRTCYMDGGYDELRALLRRKFLNFGGEIKNDAYIDELVYKRGKIKGIRLSSYEGIVYSKFLLASLDINDFLKLLGKKLKRTFSRKSKTLLREYGLFTVNFGLNDAVVPVGMKDRIAYVVNEKKPLLNENLILCNLSHEKDNIKAPMGKRTLSASCIVPYQILTQNSEKLIQIKDRVVFNLKKIIPFFEENILAVYPKESKHFKNLGESEIEHVTPSPKPKFIYRNLANSYLGISAISNRTQGENLFFTGREVLPDIGHEGEIFSCYKISDHIFKEIKRLG